MYLTKEELSLRLDTITNHLATIAISNNISQSDVQRMISSIVEKHSPKQLLTLLNTANYITYFEDMFMQFRFDEYRNQISTALTGLEKQIEETYGDA